MSHRDKPNGIPLPWRHAGLFSSTAAQQKRVKDAQEQQARKAMITQSGEGAEEGGTEEDSDKWGTNVTRCNYFLFTPFNGIRAMTAFHCTLHSSESL